MQGNPDWSKNIIRVEVSCSFAEKRWSESNLPAKPPIDGGYFLLNGFPRRICVLSDAGHDNLIEPVMNIARWYQELLGVQPCALRHRFAFYELWKEPQASCT
jgi:hypothetical protein